MRYSQGDIVLAKMHPGYGQELKKYRPVVIASNYSQVDPRFVTIIPFSTQNKQKNTFEFVCHNPILEKPSSLLCWYIQTIDSTRLFTKLGSLTEEELTQMKKVLASFW